MEFIYQIFITQVRPQFDLYSIYMKTLANCFWPKGYILIRKYIIHSANIYYKDQILDIVLNIHCAMSLKQETTNLSQFKWSSAK